MTKPAGGATLRVAVLLACIAALAVTAGSASGGSSAAKPPKLTAKELKADDTFQGVKSESGRIAHTDPSLLNRSDSTPVDVFVKYDFDATASYHGGVSGLAPTSPSTTGKALHENQAAVNAYEAHATSVADKISDAITAAVPDARVRKTFTTVYGGVAATVPANAVSTILGVKGVIAVQKDALQQPDTSATPQFIGASNVWPSLGGPAKAGDGVTVGVIDTGIWPEHPSFADNAGLSAPPKTYGCQFGDGSDPQLGPAFTCNKKLIGAYAFTNTYMTVIGSLPGEFCNNVTKKCSARDPEGHGTHTASTAAGDPVPSAPLFGVDRGPISGMAPGAHVIMYRVCLAQGCFNSDSIAAIQQGILDDIDVINYSISGGNNPYTDPVELTFLDAFNAGISVNASAGNSGPGAGTVAHGGPWVTTVGASTSNRFFTSTLHLTANGGKVFDKEGVTITADITSPTDVVLGTTLGSTRCLNPLPPGSATGKIVACERGTNARVDKGFNVLQGGAAGMILYNPINQDVETDNHWLPAIHLNGPNADLVAFITSNTGVKATWTTGAPSATQGDVMAAFSSRGPSTDFVKPDVTAPGIQVLAGTTPSPTGITNGPPGQLYMAIAGTSMSSPHSAGASALVKAAHPDWTPAEIKSALMTSSAQGVVKEDGTTPFDPFDAGAGSIRVDKAVHPTLVFNETFENFVSSIGVALDRVNLNIPSVDATTMPGTLTTFREARNVTGVDQQFDALIQSPPGATITVQKDNTFGVPAGQRRRLSITISAPTLDDGQYFGRVTLDPKKDGYNDVTIPIAFFKKQGTISLKHTCSPTTFPRRTGFSHCTVAAQNLNAAPADVQLKVENGSAQDRLDYSNVSPPGSLIGGNQGVQWQGTLTPALAPKVTGITSGGLFGYLPLSAFGIAPVPGVGDETIVNFAVPAFKYGQEVYTRFGVDSNGYVVVGGGTAQDNECCPPQTFPNPGRPNNVLAPFWSDLNPGAGGAVRVAELTDGTNSWLVIEWTAVPVFGTTKVQSFQIWLQEGATEKVTYEYGTMQGPDPATPFNVGAENRDGTSGVNVGSAPATGSELTVMTTGPTPGGSVSIEFAVSSRRAGTFLSIASLTSNLTPGITQQVVTLTVTP